ncbi:sterol desaturase family protein [Bdellovibrio sp. 22V]|uniref:sterol desaturase family protein n=1 Tax=Bdellovibrio TaxID=958 RepID=UPI0025433614|nr:sterol desaturase family protein [Bdellovibrio sp. 22V]WII71635.1 sterol desaturase family protein [Bdellovibrio sp. 22V]
MNGQILPSILLLVSTLFFFIWERVFPGRVLPHSKNWYLRAILINLVQLAMVGIAGLTWNKYFREYTLFHVGGWPSPALEGFFYWFIGTFVFYWWHRLRHTNGWWLIFHQLHHSPSRIEVLTSFYKHPVEIAADSILIGFIIYTVFGGSAEAGAWYALYAATGEYFYHANIKTPRWFGYFIQRPEHHSIHHQLGVHKYNYSDITWWDRIFGTFKDTDDFASRCGFPEMNETKIKEILLFKDVY